MNRKITVALGFLILFSGVLWGQSKAQRQAKLAAFREQAIAREQALAAAEKRGDLAAVLAVLDKDFFEVGGDGNRYTKDDVARYFPDLKVHDIRLEDFRVEHAGRDGVLLAYVAHVDATYQGQPLPPRVAVSSLWMRRGRQWKLLFHQATPKPEPVRPQ